MNSITLSYLQSDNDLMEQFNELPSSSWFAVRALENFNNASDLVDSGRLKKGEWSKLEKSDFDKGLACWKCGGDIFHPVNAGICKPYKASPKFNDQWHCKGKHNDKDKVVCAACEAAQHANYFPNFNLNACFTKDKAYQLTLDEDLISFLINPPKPPYLFFIGEKKRQHMVWLSNLTLDNRAIVITKGRSHAIVNREEALIFAEKLNQILIKANAIRKAQQQILLSTPLMSSRIEINKISSTNMKLSDSVRRACLDLSGDNQEVALLRESLRKYVAEVDSKSLNYQTWFVSVMFLKAMLINFEPKPKELWQTISKPG